MNWSDPESIVLSATAAVVAILGVRRKFSSDGKEISKDAAERGLMAILRQERDDAMKNANEAWARTNSDASRIATLEAKNEYLVEQITHMRAQIAAMEAELHRFRKEFRDSGHGQI